ncbi:unnamed protein product [Hydatigera taeniaeformis]|uniref:Cytoplasmic dynein 2 heavy chain 1 n=1 Tax=Hydatigena taeniaeformis TaxID=6205 RepID=A0A158RDA4_HYDTA|nr:unnamed protein product [Hydatigera taeniaeformis]
MGFLDPRKKFIAKSLELCFNLEDSNTTVVYSNSIVETFLNTSNAKLLFVTLTEEQEILFWLEVPNMDQYKVAYAFLKAIPEELTEENIHSGILTVSVRGSVSQNFYNVIDTLYAPLLMKYEEKAVNQNPLLQTALHDLVTGLSNLAKLLIFDIASEAEFWKAKSRSVQVKLNRDRHVAETIYRHLKPAADATQRLQLHCNPGSGSTESADPFGFLGLLTETLESTVLDSLDDIWRLSEESAFTPYPESRMRSLIEATTCWICRTLVSYLNAPSDGSGVSTVWSRPFKQVLEIRCVYSKLVKVFDLQERERLGLQQSLDEFLCKGLLTSSTKPGLQNSAFYQFICNPLAYSPCNIDHWNALVSLFNEGIRVAEVSAVPHLHFSLSSIVQNSAEIAMVAPQVILEFQRYGVLYGRPVIAKALQADREVLLGFIEVGEKAIREEFSTRLMDSSENKFIDPTHTRHGKNIPDLVDRLVWAGQLEARVSEHLILTDSILHDLTNYGSLKEQKLQLLKDEISQWCKDQFHSWCRLTQLALDATGKDWSAEEFLTFDSSGSLLCLSTTDGRLRVGYPDGLVRLQREVRLLSGLGYSVPQRLRKVAAQAEALCRHAIVLKQVAHFYNSIDSEMLPCQQALMLKSALAFEHLIKFGHQKGKGDVCFSSLGDQLCRITWNQTEQIPAFIALLQTTARNLMEENRQLRKVHQELVSKVVALMEVDLLREPGKWREGLAWMRCRLAETASTGGYPADHMRPWLAHLDRQLYKALSVQYRLGLETLSQRMPAMHIELIYQHSQLSFQPPLEEACLHFSWTFERNHIKAKYYREIRKFIGIPLHFRGILDYQNKDFTTDTSCIFPLIIEKHMPRFRMCYHRAEILFTRLQAVMDLFLTWVALGSVNLEDLVDVQCRDLADYENLLFRMVNPYSRFLFDPGRSIALKRRGRAVEELPNEAKIDCFIVNCVPAKNGIERLLQNLYEALLNCLRRSVQADLVTADAFLTDALERLSIRPQNLEEMAGARGGHSVLTREQLRLADRLACIEKKDKLLRHVSGCGVGSFSTIKSKWTKFQLMMDSFKLMMDEQMNVMQSNLDSRVRAFVAQVERFSARWQHTQPPTDLLASGDRKQCLAAVTIIKSWKEDFAEIEKALNDISMDCAYFKTPLPNLDLAEELRSSLAKAENMWSMYEQFTLELRDLEKEKWIAFRMELFRLIGLSHEIRLEEVSFGTILSAAPWIVANASALKALAQRAQSERVMCEALQELDVWAAGTTFLLTPYTDCRGKHLKLIKDWQDIITQVGDKQTLLASLQGSPSFNSFADRVDAWERRLVDLDASLSSLQMVQRRWVYLEPIFGGGALKVETPRFNRVDADFRSLMADIECDSRVVSLTKGRRENELQGVLTNMQNQLIRCQRALTEYLEEKRNLFPRFYFLGDDDLLEVLGQSSNPVIIQTHLRKLFQAIQDAKFLKIDNGINITDFCSREGESVPMKKPVLVDNEIEKWLRELEAEMHSTLGTMFFDCLEGRGELHDYPGQILALRESVRFSEKVEKAIKTGKLSLLLRELQTTLKSYAEANIRCQWAGMNSDSGDTSQMLSRVSSAKLSTLILDTGHNINVVSHLIREVATSVHDWTWQKQLRFYSARDVEATAPKIRMANAEFTYTFEYQGNNPRLVHTPLTDKCYLTLTQALQSGLGGNPYGPAGTGKTESVKQLGELFGRQVLVFNCDGGIDVESMGRIFVGLVKCGAWGCFDEFNRLEEAVMSAISTQIQVIQNALRSGAPTVELLGKSINPNPTASIFITLNPAGKGYGGRQKLPGNLKQLFRPVSMTKPDNELIAETLLFSYGFSHGHELGKKLVAIFTLSSQTLSVQQHYDWGLRALKSVLRRAGMLLHQTKQKMSQEDSLSAANLPESPSQQLDSLVVETQLIIQSVRSCSLARLTHSDATRFEALLGDVFPNLRHHAGAQEDDFTKKLITAIHEVLAENHLYAIEHQVKKTLEVYSLLNQRTGVVVVGPSGCGKSTVLCVLWLALQKIGVRVKRYIMNPKALSRTHLLGRIDPDTREWTDGVLTRSARDVVREPSGTVSWIICDGDIDPEWVESLNSVLDDNGLLTLPSGERIRFGSNVNFIFETHDLSCASPATVSRMGIVFISDEMLGADAIIKTWLLKQPKEHRQFLSDMLNTAFCPCLSWVETKNEYLIEASYTATILNGLSHLVGATNRARFAVGLIRGLGSNLLEPVKSQLAAKVYEATGETPPDPSHPLNVRVDEETGTRLVAYSDEISLVDMDLASLQGTDEINAENKNFIEAKFVQDFAPTLRPPLVISAHIRCAIDAFRLWLDDPSAKQSFLLVGPEGCGKGLLLEHCLSESKGRAHVIVLQCTAQTRPSNILDKLGQACVTVTGSSVIGASRVLRPKKGDRLVLLLRDLNLPKPDKWGSCEVVAFLQQILTYRGFYDANSLEFIGIEDIQIIATLTPSSLSGGLGRFLLSPRLTSILRIASITNPSSDELVKIYNCLLQHVFNVSVKPAFELATSTFKGRDCSNRLHTLASTMVHMWSQLEQTFKASGFPHCSFSLRDLTHWVIGMMRYNLAPEPISGNMWVAFAYEARRLFRDRMPGEEYRLKFDKLFYRLLNVDSEAGIGFGGWSSVQSKTLSESSLAAKFASGDPIAVESDAEIAEASIKKGQHWFVSSCLFEPHPLKSNMKPCNKVLSLVSYSSMHEIVASSLKQLARESYPKAEELVVFPDFLDLITRIDRVLSKPHGNLLLAGRCGIGRRSALRVVVHLHRFQLFTPRAGSNITKRNFQNDLKSACQSAAVDCVPTVLLLEDHHLVNEIILEAINSILSSGEAPGLISVEDVESMTSSEGANLRDIAAETNYAGTLMSFFAKRIRAYLHVVILLDIEEKENLVSCLQANPSLYKNCEISWLDKWSSVGQSILPNLLAPNLVENPRKTSFSRACLAIHNSVPYPRLASPRRFISMCTTCQDLCARSRNQLEFQITRFRAGLTKLFEARQHVNKLKMDAAKQERLLHERQAEADKALSEISLAMQGAGKQRADMEELQKRSVVEAASLEGRKATIDAEMAKIGPLLKEAQAAVGNIRSEALSEVRALRAPPDVIRDILEGVLLLMGVRDTSWASMRTFLARRGIQDEIRNFDARRITPDLRHSVEVLLKKNADSFSPKSARRASVAAAPLASWVQANVQYARVLEKLAPLEREQASLHHSLEITQAEVQRLTRDLNSVDARVANLQSVFEVHAKAATDLQTELGKAKHTLSIAEDLISGLESEHGRWEKEVDSLNEQLKVLPVMSLMAAGFITYLSSCSEDVRQNTMANWWQQLEELELRLSVEDCAQKTSRFDLLRFLVTEKDRLHWKTQGLPSDSLSLENAVVILRSNLFPFIVAPSGSVVRWLKSQLEDQQIEVTDQRSHNFPTVLELAIRFGKALVVQEIDRIDPILFPILRRDFSLQETIGPRKTVKLGDKEVDYNENFRLFMMTREPWLSTSSVQPGCIASLVTVVNFQTTRSSLVGHLLEITLQHECSELETRRLELLEGEEVKKLELAQLEDQLLEELASSRGNILENTDLLDSLNKTKHSSITVAQTLAEFERLQVELENERDEFRCLAEGGSRVFFALSDLLKINNMYQFSLSSFTNLFRRALESPCETTLSVQKRMMFFLRRLEALVVEHVLRALFKVDRLTFLLHLTYCLRPCEVKDAAGQPKLYEKLRFNDAEIWSHWMHSEDSECGKLPAALSDIPLAPLQTMIVIQTLQPTALYRTMNEFTKKALGLPHLSPSGISLLRLFTVETSPREPVLLVTSPGADPSQELADAAAAASAASGGTIGCNYHEVAMGQGQLEIALSEISAAAQSGGWVCLKNLHLVTHWLPVLEKHINLLISADCEMEEVAARTQRHLHPHFRLWLTTEPHDNFPSTLLQSCLKVAYEAPPGLKNNLKRTYESWHPDFFAKSGSLTRTTALACLAWFHAVLQERRSFIPQSWTKFYEFTSVDVRAAASTLDRLITPAVSAVPTSAIWPTVRGLLGSAIYGGRMDNAFDFSVLKSFLNCIFSDSTLSLRQLGSLKLPNTTNLKDYVTAIDQLSDMDDPHDLGLPANINKTAQLAAAANVLGQLRLLQSHVGSSHESDRSLWAEELNPILGLWRKINADGALLPSRDKRLRDMLVRVEEKSLHDAKESPVLSFLHREMTSALDLIARIHSNLGSLAKFLRGTQVLSQELYVVVCSLLQSKTPAAWLAMWNTGPEDSYSFIRSAVAKTQALQKWLLRSESLPRFFSPEVNCNLADFFNPAIFLNALRQQTARHLQLAIDQLKLVSKWPSLQRELESYSGSDFLAISNLQLEGALFKDGRLTECHATSPAVSALPDIQIAWRPCCPLCLEPMDSDDVSFFPCPCLYQPYDPDAPAVRVPQTSTGESKRKPMKRKKEVLNKPQISKETFKLLPELRVIQTNLVFVVGLPQWISKDKEILKGPQYFGQFGKVYKVEVNANQTFTGPQGQPSISAYITYDRSEDAMRAVLTLDQSMMHGRQLRVSLGTTKYCSQFLRGHKCNKHECMYLHGLGDPKASFTKEQMHAGKHTEYMKALLDEFVANQAATATTGCGTNPEVGICDTSSGNTVQNQESTVVASDSRATSVTVTDALRSSERDPIAIVRSGEPQSANDHVVPSYSSSSCISSYESSKGLFYSQRHVDPNHQGLDCGSCGSSTNMNAFPDIDFDPIRESQVGLAELMASEQPPQPQVSLATQTFPPSLPLMFTPPPGFENSPAAAPEDIASLIAATSQSRNFFDSVYSPFAQIAAAAALAHQNQQQPQHWTAFNGAADLEFLTHLLRQAMQIDGGQHSQSAQPSTSMGSPSGGGTDDFKCYTAPSTSATATTLGVRFVSFIHPFV